MLFFFQDYYSILLSETGTFFKGTFENLSNWNAVYRVIDIPTNLIIVPYTCEIVQA